MTQMTERVVEKVLGRCVDEMRAWRAGRAPRADTNTSSV